jgi:hypothetical protein
MIACRALGTMVGESPPKQGYIYVVSLPHSYSSSH